ncbi:dihydrofolate reductase family protein [Leifsonia sp. NPDC077715]|uniref:dihydrofolate reductase family protein n=1 Tax=Leifsonia sp. NPDC077715 TaxID=3155539 RepID=UPI0034256FEC
MTRIVADITMSLDGFVTGPNAGPGNGLGDGGEALHRWVFAGDPADDRILQEGTQRSGAVVMGRNLFDVIDAPDGWSDELGYGAHEVGRPPFFAVTSTPPERRRLTNLDFTFVTTGLAYAIEQARAAAQERSAASGRELDVVLMGGGALIGSAVAAGLVDVLSLHVSPLILGGGDPLFRDAVRRELVQRDVLVTPYATHLTYEVG